LDIIERELAESRLRHPSSWKRPKEPPGAEKRSEAS
jgi:hypothetical protein